jgi:hypothetical protein
MRKIKDKEGVVFQIELDPRVSPESRNRDSVLFVQSLIKDRLESGNVFPLNNKVGFHGDIDHMSYFLGQICDMYLIQFLKGNQIHVLK